MSKSNGYDLFHRFEIKDSATNFQEQKCCHMNYYYKWILLFNHDRDFDRFV